MIRNATLMTWAVLLTAGSNWAQAVPPPASMPATGASPRVFYPPPPDPPRFQFLLSFSDTQTLGLTPASSPDELPLGVPKLEQNVKFVNPYGIAARDGKIYVCDLGSSRVHVLDLEKKQYRVLGDGKNLVRPLNITIGPDGTRYVCDLKLRQVAVFDANDKFVRYLGDPKRCGPADLAVHGDELFVVDSPGGKIEVWSKAGELKRTIPATQPGKEADRFKRPAFVAVGPDKNVYVSDTLASEVRAFDRKGMALKSIGGPGDTPGSFARPKGLRIDPANDLLYVADAHFDTLQVFSPKGQLLMVLRDQAEGPHQMISPTGVAIDPTSLKFFARYVAEDFRAESLVFVTCEFGKKNKVLVYAFGFHPI